MTWHDHANCRGHGDIMYDHDRWSVARRLCDTCPVAADCLADVLWWEQGSLDPGQRHGLWAGLTPSQRITLTRTRRSAQQAAVDAARQLRHPPAATEEVA